jgi:hypothetical protein
VRFEHDWQIQASYGVFAMFSLSPSAPLSCRDGVGQPQPAATPSH